MGLWHLKWGCAEWNRRHIYKGHAINPREPNCRPCNSTKEGGIISRGMRTITSPPTFDRVLCTDGIHRGESGRSLPGREDSRTADTERHENSTVNKIIHFCDDLKGKLTASVPSSSSSNRKWPGRCYLQSGSFSRFGRRKSATLEILSPNRVLSPGRELS